VAEVALDFPRAWVEFADPADPSVVVRADVTWLTSSWTCIFGRGCPGIVASRPDDGCCVFGAHFTDSDDEARVTAAAQRLTPQEWQNHRRGRRGGVVQVDDDGARQTRVVDGACVFHNQADADGPGGCALHTLAAREGVNPLETKPDVCWQLPIRRGFREVSRPDGSTYTEVTIGEFDRRAWGAGGHDLDWYCSGSPLAHVGAESVLHSCKAELVALIGAAAYDELVRLCAATAPVHPASR
jgi:hypothetical protein